MQSFYSGTILIYYGNYMIDEFINPKIIYISIAVLIQKLNIKGDYRVIFLKISLN